MLTINEQSPVKSSNFKKVLAALSSVAVIGAGTTYLMSSSRSSVTSSKLSSFVTDDMKGTFNFEMTGDQEYIATGHFSKTVDENGEWDVEYYHNGKGDLPSSYILKEGQLYQRARNETQYYCGDRHNNLAYGQYKYDLMKAVDVDLSELSVEAASRVRKVCPENDEFYLVENGDVGKLVVCPQRNVNGLEVGIVGSSFHGTFYASEGKKEFVIPSDAEFGEEKCDINDINKFNSATDYIEEENSQTLAKFDKILNVKDMEKIEKFPFPEEDRKLEMGYMENGASGNIDSHFSFSNVVRPTENGGLSGDMKNRLNCDVVHGAGNNKGYKRIKNWRRRYAHFPYSSVTQGNNPMTYNSRDYQPCWVYWNMVFQPKVTQKQAHKPGGKYSFPYSQSQNVYQSFQAQTGYDFTGYNYYWGKNLFNKKVTGMVQGSTLWGGNCDWTTFSDFNSNQIKAFKETWLQDELATQICGNPYCVAGKSSGYKQLIMAHSMGTMFVMQLTQMGKVKKGSRATIALAAAPLLGSVGALGVSHFCGLGWGIAAGYALLGTLWNGWNLGSNFFPMGLVSWALDITSSCNGKGNGPIDVIHVLKLANTNTIYGPKYFSLTGHGSYPGWHTPNYVDHRICGLSPHGLAGATMKKLSNTSCQGGTYCLQMKCPARSGKSYKTCHYRGCSMALPSSFKCESSTKKSDYQFWKHQHDNHVSRHSCETNGRYYGQHAQNGGTLTLSWANHKTICCKVGNGTHWTLKPCGWYKMIAQQADKK